MIAKLSPRVFSPSRARLAEASECVRGIEDPKEAWETFSTAGLISTNDVESEFRAFDCDTNRRANVCECGKTDADHPLTHPPTIDACVAMASDLRGILTAELMALEACQRLSEHGCPCPDLIVWRVESWKPDKSVFGRKESGRETSWLGRTRSVSPAVEWTKAADEEIRSFALKGELGALFAWMRAHRSAYRGIGKNPWEPIVSLFEETGYALDDITRDRISLVCPPL